MRRRLAPETSRAAGPRPRSVLPTWVPDSTVPRVQTEPENRDKRRVWITRYSHSIRRFVAYLLLRTLVGIRWDVVNRVSRLIKFNQGRQGSRAVPVFQRQREASAWARGRSLDRSCQKWNFLKQSHERLVTRCLRRFHSSTKQSCLQCGSKDPDLSDGELCSRKPAIGMSYK